MQDVFCANSVCLLCHERIMLMNEPTSLGLLLKRYRMAAGLSQETLAQRASLSARAVSDLERGLHRAPRSATLDLLAAALDLTTQQRTLLLAAAHPELLSRPPERGPAALGLPAAPTPLIGRERESTFAVSLLRGDTVRLVTLTGPGGMGKTRLALEVAHTLSSAFRDGAAFVNLAQVHDAELVPGVIAQALYLRDDGSAPLDQQVRAQLRDRHVLLLLDNFEHVIGAALFVADLLAWCPHVAVLVTSRAPLRLRGEHVLPLGPLPLEDAIVLFRERAHAVRPAGTFAVSEAAELCERVDCLPLAIELAASQVAMLSLPEVIEQLHRHMALALEGARDLPVRQRTMEAAIGWSYDLLTADQQRCFRALGVFIGGGTLTAARAICWAESDAVTEAAALLTLAALVDASVIQVEIAPEGYARLHLLELVRAYALERLRAEGEEEACRSRHASYYARLAESLMASGFGRGAQADMLGHELPNARAALEWAESRHDAELGMRLAGFARLWDICGLRGEADFWLQRMLALDDEARTAGEPAAPLQLRAERLYGHARVSLNRGNLEKAEALAQEAVVLARQIGDEASLSEAFATVGMIAQARGDIEQATVAFTESAAHAGTTTERPSRYHAIYFLAELARLQGDYSRAHLLFERALDGARAAENGWDCAVMMTMLGHIERQQLDYIQARAHYLESLARFHAFGSPSFFAWCLEGYAGLLCAEGSYMRATRLCAAAALLRQQSDAPLPAAERDAFERTLANAREALGEAVFSGEWMAGSSLTEAAALADAMKDV